MSIIGATNKSDTESLDQSGKEKSSTYVFMATLMKRRIQRGGDDLLERKKLIQSQYIKFCLLRSVCDYMSIIFVYQSSLSNGSLLICILVKSFVESIYIYFPQAFFGGGRLWRYGGGY